MSEPCKQLTFRCSICASNWPYHVRFTDCPRCGIETSPLKLPFGDCALTTAAANVELHVLGFTEHVPARKQIPIKTTAGLKDDIKQLHEDLDRWATEEPPWLK